MYIIYFVFDGGNGKVFRDTKLPPVITYRPSECHMLIPTWDAFNAAS